MGAVMAEVLDGRVDSEPMARFRLAGDPPGHFGRPWFLPLVGAYYRLQDLLH
ncbi:MAG: hypothetical protein R3E65_04140 [Steroidobacteraceae bacterium]